MHTANVTGCVRYTVTNGVPSRAASSVDVPRFHECRRRMSEKASSVIDHGDGEGTERRGRNLMKRAQVQAVPRGFVPQRGDPPRGKTGR